MTPFSFNAAVAGPTSAAAGATSGGVTPWYRINGRTQPSSVIISGTFVATILPEYSNVQDFDKGSDYVPDAQSFNQPTLHELPTSVANFVRYRCTAYTSGTPKLSFADALGPGGLPFIVGEDTKKTPAPSSASS